MLRYLCFDLQDLARVNGTLLDKFFHLVNQLLLVSKCLFKRHLSALNETILTQWVVRIDCLKPTY
jgi:hypothetical protein